MTVLSSCAVIWQVLENLSISSPQNYDDYIEAALTKRIRRSYEDAVFKVSKKHLLDYDVSIMMDRAGEQSIYSPAKNVLPRIGTSL